MFAGLLVFRVVHLKKSLPRRNSRRGGTSLLQSCSVANAVLPPRHTAVVDGLVCGIIAATPRPCSPAGINSHGPRPPPTFVVNHRLFYLSRAQPIAHNSMCNDLQMIPKVRYVPEFVNDYASCRCIYGSGMITNSGKSFLARTRGLNQLFVASLFP
jgi:hypothetical protein